MFFALVDIGLAVKRSCGRKEALLWLPKYTALTARKDEHLTKKQAFEIRQGVTGGIGT